MTLTLEALLKLMNITPEEALAAAVSQFSPVQASALTGSWRRSEHFGKTAPTTDVVDQLFQNSKYTCALCGRRSQLTLDHINGDPTNHATENLRVLCRPCNRTKGIEDPDEDHQLRILTAAFELWGETGSFPTNKAVQDRAKVKQIGGATYKLRWLKFLLGNPAEASTTSENDSEPA